MINPANHSSQFNRRRALRCGDLAASVASACDSISRADPGRATPARTCPRPPSRAIERDPVEKYVGPDFDH